LCRERNYARPAVAIATRAAHVTHLLLNLNAKKKDGRAAVSAKSNQAFLSGSRDSGGAHLNGLTKKLGLDRIELWCCGCVIGTRNSM